MMKMKKLLSAVLTAMLICIASSIAMTANAAEITPTKPSEVAIDGLAYYKITNANELYWFAGLVNGTLTDGTTQDKTAYAVLAADITVNSNVLNSNGELNSGTFTEWTPIGNYSAMYDGIFDGQGHVISGLYYNDTSDNTSYAGLFGYAFYSTISNVGVVDSYFNGNYAGGICSYNSSGTITGCYSAANISGAWYAGGICGFNNANVKNCIYNSKFFSGDAVSTIWGEPAQNCYGKTTDEFASGNVAYTLNDSKTSGTLVWGQTLSGDNADKYPVAHNENNTVYYDSSRNKYVNVLCSSDKHTDTVLSENNGICSDCGYYQAATKNASNIYEISNAGQLYWFAGLVNGDINVCIGDVTQNRLANAVLTKDITVNKNVLNSNGQLNSGTFKQWTPIGTDSSNYAGIFNGQGHVISGLYCNSSENQYVGLFGHVYNNDTANYCVLNVGVVDSYFNGDYTGGICGYLNAGKIFGCYSSANINGAWYAGGICGSNDGSVENCVYNSTFFSGDAIGKDNSDNASVTFAKTTDEFASGAVAYILNDSKTSGTLVWGQTLSGDNTDKYPVAHNENNTVYHKLSTDTYSNENCADIYHNKLSEHNGICPDCGYCQAAVKNASDVYEISNAGQLYWFAGLVNGTLTDGTEQNRFANAVLTADITVNKNVLNSNGKLNSGTFKQWTPIGTDSSNYVGKFNGQGHVISGLYCNSSENQLVGLFGCINNATVLNVGIVDSYFNLNYSNYISNYIGGICGNCSYGNITGCYISAVISSETGTVYCGAVTGANATGSVQNCVYNSSYFVGKAIGQDEPNTASVTFAKTTEEFASGEVAYILNGNSSTGVWGQNLSGDKKQAYPSCDGATVYALTDGYSNTRIVAMRVTNDVPSFENATVYDKDGIETNDITYSNDLKITTVYVKIDGAKDNIKPKIKISCGDDEITSDKWTAAGDTNIYYAQFIGNFDDFGTIEVSYEGATSVRVTVAD